MIGVIAHPAYLDVIVEFFELFKTPWEFYHADREYDVLLCDESALVDGAVAKLLVVIDGRPSPEEIANRVKEDDRAQRTRFLVHQELRIPLYGKNSTFQGKSADFLIDAESQEPAGYVESQGDRKLVRIGYDLFYEVRTLLTAGQQSANAAFPTLELHIALLRNSILLNGIMLVEVPPTPAGYRFIGCLTHDVDHPLLRKHRCDHAMFGFVYRAIFKSLSDFLRRRATFRQLWTNWVAVFKLPFVYLGLAQDFWQSFVRYSDLESGLPSSFFVIPFKNEPGRLDHCRAPTMRASAYAANDISDEIRTLISAGCEIGLHGIDAWRDSESAFRELEEIRRITAQREVGVRMHWLYTDRQSPEKLESAGAGYDSSIGFNDAVGYRAGTTQVYKPLGATRLLELPLHIMDTALFFPAYLDLSTTEAAQVVDAILDNAEQFGGTVTVNWHDRSIAPERLWGGFYLEIIEKLKSRGAWFATSADAVMWFRRRRSVSFERVASSETIRLNVSQDGLEHLPGLMVRVHNPQASPHQTEADTIPQEAMDISAENGMFVGRALPGTSVSKAAL